MMRKPDQSDSAEQIFLEVVELEPSSRAAWLDDRCGGDLALRRVIEHLLQSDSRNADGLLETPALVLAGEQTPIRVAGYRITEAIAEGAIGAVFKAVHEATGRNTAIKLIRTGLATPSRALRFQLETRTLARLDDDCIARVYDGGVALVEYPDGLKVERPFIAMEYIDGQDILSFARTRRLSLPERVVLIESVARGLQHAHQAGVLHRDLKPGNLLVTSDGKPKMIDFGLARVVAPDADAPMTVAGAIMGTPRYMSPEQLVGDRDRVDTRSDIYGLGAVLYEMLADRAPISLPDILTPSTVMRALSTEAPRLGALRPEVGSNLAAVVHKAIDRDPARRYGSAGEFADDLRRWLAGEPVLARPPNKGDVLRAFVRKNKAVVAGAFIASAAILLFGSVATWQAVRASGEAARARRAAEEEKKSRADAEASMKFLTDMLAQASPQGKRAGAQTKDLKLIDAVNAAAKTVNQLDDRPLVRAQVEYVLGRTYLALGDFGVARQHLTASFDLRRQNEGETLETIDAKHELARVYYESTHYREAEALQAEVLAWRKQNQGERHFDTLRTMADYSATLSRLKRNNEAFAMLQDALAGFETIKAGGGTWTDDNESRRLRFRTSLGGMLMGQQGDPRGSIEVLRPTLVEQRRLLGNENPYTLDTIRLLGDALESIGRYDEAIPLLEETYQTSHRSLGPDHPTTLKNANALAGAYGSSGRLTDAARMYEQMGPGMERTYGVDNINTLAVRRTLAGAWIKLDRYDDAESLLQRTLQTQEEKFGPDDVVLAGTLEALAQIDQHRGQYPAALAKLERARALHAAARGEEHPDVARVLKNTALCLKDAGRIEEARTAARRAVEILEAKLGPEAPATRSAQKLVDELGQP